MTVLIVTRPNDADAQVIKLAINHLGTECSIFYSGDFVSDAEWSLDPDTNVLETEFRGKSERLELRRFSSIWMRRPCGIVPRPLLETIRERVAAENEASSFLNSVHRVLERGKFVANRLNATRVAQEKAFQFSVAREVGLPMPRTLISNARERILQFHADLKGNIIYKPLVPALWETKPYNYDIVRTTSIDDRKVLEESDLKSAPGIYQEQIEKATEIRVTILGRTVLAVEKSFPDRSGSDLDVDWRVVNRGAKFRRHFLPDDIAQKCVLLLRQLDLLMGTLDLIVDSSGNYYFLEVNPQGQFIWGDQVCSDINHLEAMAEFLISEDPDFRYSEKNAIRLAQFSDRSIFEKMEAHEREWHYGDATFSQYGTVTVSLVEGMTLSEEFVQRQVDQQLSKLAGEAGTQMPERTTAIPDGGSASASM